MVAWRDEQAIEKYDLGNPCRRKNRNKVIMLVGYILLSTEIGDEGWWDLMRVDEDEDDDEDEESDCPVFEIK